MKKGRTRYDWDGGSRAQQFSPTSSWKPAASELQQHSRQCVFVATCFICCNKWEHPSKRDTELCFTWNQAKFNPQATTMWLISLWIVTTMSYKFFVKGPIWLPRLLNVSFSRILKSLYMWKSSYIPIVHTSSKQLKQFLHHQKTKVYLKKKFTLMLTCCFSLICFFCSFCFFLRVTALNCTFCTQSEHSDGGNLVTCFDTSVLFWPR